MMKDLLICTLIIVSIIYVYQIYKLQLYKSCIIFFHWFNFNTFVSPVIGYRFFDVDSYISFSDEIFNQYIILGIFYILSIILISYLIHCGTKRRNIKLNVIRIKSLKKYFLATTFCLIFIYIFIYFKEFPLLKIIMFNQYISSLERPDVSGSLPYYFTFSTVLSVVLPMVYFYDLEHESNSINKKYIALIIFLLAIGGNKGFVAYFVIFYWIQVLNLKIDHKIILSIAIIFSLYILIMYGENFDILMFKDYIVSAFRRFFITQGAMFINRLEMIERGFIFDEKTISYHVYSYVYNQEGGSAPTYFLGDLIVKNGYLCGMFYAVIVSYIVVLLSYSIDGGYKNLYIKYALFYIIYLIGNATLDMNFLIRLIIIIISTSILYLNIPYLKEVKNNNKV